jgi:hemerythrin-like domain-containing protein
MMKPIGPLMWEHRLIEKMLDVLRNQVETIRSKGDVNGVLIDQAVDFFRTYADRTHHGKEEDILFRDLEKKALSPEHGTIVDELMEEHKVARKMVGGLLDAKERHFKGSPGGAAEVADYLSKLVSFYPLHIEKEDKRFFFPCLSYFSEEEQKKMLEEFYEFDRKMIHEKYTSLVEWFLGQAVAKPSKFTVPD